MFRPEVWQAKLRVLQDKGEAQTRRLMTFRGTPDGLVHPTVDDETFKRNLVGVGETGRYKVGETVYVKEAWATEKRYDDLPPRAIPTTAHIHFMADGVGEWPLDLEVGKLRSLMFLRESMARYFLTIKDVRPERLQEITPEDCEAEGISWAHTDDDDKVEAYASLWDSINAKPRRIVTPTHKPITVLDNTWSSNPWIWRYVFALVPRPEGATR